MLSRLGLDTAKVVSKHPKRQIFSHSLNPQIPQMYFLSQTKRIGCLVGRFCPTSLSLTEDRIRGKLAFLEGVGLDSTRLVNSCPKVLSFNVHQGFP